MTAPTTKIFTVGLNAVRIYDLDDTTGRIGATSLTAYDGISVGGPVSFAYEPADPTPIVHQAIIRSCNRTYCHRRKHPQQLSKFPARMLPP